MLVVTGLEEPTKHYQCSALGFMDSTNFTGFGAPIDDVMVNVAEGNVEYQKF